MPHPTKRSQSASSDGTAAWSERETSCELTASTFDGPAFGADSSNSPSMGVST